MAESQTLSRAVEAVTGNLGKTGTVTVAVIGILKPMLLVTPILWLFGFGNVVRAGSFAARWMASIGNVVARSLYATLQGAGAGGRAVARVAGVVRTFSVIAIVLVLLKIYHSWN
ncbi:hypothetical protein F5Y14DRAFT_396437 [Nemania sp. NC0429]|nr:hypothetical protein F5Y14DRAFT_396437 [Nemania sp. NC0429]